MKRILFSLCLFSAALTALAQGNVLQYTSMGGGLWVSNKDSNGNRVSYSGDIVIPDVVTINGVEYNVTGIAPSAFYGCRVTSVVIGENVNFIGGEAFRYCSSLESITIPASVDTIGAWAFCDGGLKNVRFEDSETPIKLWDYAGYCIFSSSPLETVYLGRNYISGGRPFRGFSTLQTVPVSDMVNSLQTEEFRDSYGLRDVSLGENIAEIGKSAFYNCDSLYAIILPESVLGIGDYAFYHCDTLSLINIPFHVSRIGGEAFRYCRDLEDISIPASVDTIGAWAFCNAGLKNVMFEDGETPIKLWDYAGYCIFSSSPLETVYLGSNYISGGRPFRGFSTLQTVTVSDMVNSLQTEEFKDSYGLRDVRLGENIAEIGKSAFYNCDSLYAITLPESVLRIGDYAFYHCDTLSFVNIPSKVFQIGGEAFRYCHGLENIVIPASVDTIGAWAFCNSGLKNVRFDDSDRPVRLWDYAGYCIFSSSPLETVYLGRNYISGGRPFRGFSTLQTVTVSDMVNSLQSEEFMDSYGLRNVRLGANIAEIGKSAFYNCDTLYAITLPESVLRIGDYAFYHCDTLSFINIPSHVYQIGGEAFRYCSDLESISIPASVDTIGAWAFCNSGLKNVKFADGEAKIKLWDYAGYCIFSSSPLETVYLGRNYISGGRPFRGFPTLKNVIVSDMVTTLQTEEFKNSQGLRIVMLGANISEIGNSAFEHCDTLASIRLPESVLRIGDYAFYRCDSLSVINIPSHVYQIGGDAFRYCSDLESITIPASVDTIGAWAFSDAGLKNVRFDDSETPIKLWDYAGYCIFNACPLDNVYLGRNYISGGRPFRGFTTMKTATIGRLVNNLQTSEFEGCKNLKTIYSLNEIPPTCASKVFYGVNKNTCILSVPTQSIDLYKAAYAWNEFFNIEDAVNDIRIDGKAAIDNGAWFNMNGQRLDNAKRGMNILRTEDGKAVKIFMK